MKYSIFLYGEFFDLSRKPIFRESFAFGNAEVENKGFIISEQCIECGCCTKVCPQQCIIKGHPHIINQFNCLHCGLCFEECPVKAIKRKDEK